MFKSEVIFHGVKSYKYSMSLNEAEKLAETLITDGDREYLKHYNMYDDVRTVSNWLYIRWRPFNESVYHQLSTLFYNIFNAHYKFSLDDKDDCDNMLGELMNHRKLIKTQPYLEREKWDY